MKYTILAAGLALTACVAPSQHVLDKNRAECAAGDQTSCILVPGLRDMVAEEHARQAANVATGLLAGAAIIAIGAAAYQPVYHPGWTASCTSWGNTTNCYGR